MRPPSARSTRSSASAARCASSIADGAAITFAAVAERAQVSRAFLYQHAELRAEIEALRAADAAAPARCRFASAPATRRCAPGCAPRWMRASASARRSPGCARSSRSRTAASRELELDRRVAPHVSAPAPSSARPPQSQSVLEAVLERITYANEDTGYTIARVATERTGPDLLTVVGPLLGAQVGESLRLTGRWSSHPKYGKQFQVHSYHHGAAGHDPGHPPLPGFGADQGDRADDGRADGGAFRHRHPDRSSRSSPAG